MNFFSVERQKPVSFEETQAEEKKAQEGILHQRKKRSEGKNFNRNNKRSIP
jgi:hypothetical protein